MVHHIDYYFATVSPWMYLGHERFVALARQHGATIAVKPMNLGEVFPVSGGLPLSKRSPQRQAYRLVELKRWSEHLGVPLNLQPKYFPANGDPAACWILAAAELGTEQEYYSPDGSVFRTEYQDILIYIERRKNQFVIQENMHLFTNMKITEKLMSLQQAAFDGIDADIKLGIREVGVSVGKEYVPPSSECQCFDETS